MSDHPESGRDSDSPIPPFEPVPLRTRHDGWTAEKQIDFITALSETACVIESCRRVRMSPQSAYALRARINAASFRAAWDAALDYGIRRLSDAAISRAIHGIPVPHFYKGELIGEHRRYDKRLTMFLLRYRDPLRYAKSLDKLEWSGNPEGAAFGLWRALDELTTEVGMTEAGSPRALIDEALRDMDRRIFPNRSRGDDDTI